MMATRRMLIRSGFLAPALLALTAVAVVGRAPSAGAEEIKLTYQAGGAASRLVSPSEVLSRGRGFSIPQSSGRLNVAGSQVPISASWHGSYSSVGMDCNGDGRITGREYLRLGTSRTASFPLKLTEGATQSDYSVTLTDLSVPIRSSAVASIFGRYHVNCCMTGTYKGTALRIIDDDMDGKFSQGGRDAIAIGRSLAAMPLRKVHRIGARICRLDVSEDGKTIDVAPQENVELGVVEVPIQASLLKCLIVEDASGGQAYDLCVDGRSGIPAGNYRLCYGVLQRGNETVTMVPTGSSRAGGPGLLTYPIVAGKRNVLRIGEPVEVEFQVSLDEKEGKITVFPNVSVYGAGGERYDLSFSSGPGTPRVILMNGSSKLSEGPMPHG